MKSISCKALSLLLACAMVLGMVQFAGVPAFAQSVVDSSVADSGSGTAEDPYQISNLTQLKNVNKHLSSCYKLTADIDAGNITPIGSSSNRFFGTFDGNGKTVTVHIDLNSNSAESVGLFGVMGNLSAGATVKNLTVDGDVRCTSSGNGTFTKVGGLVGEAYNSTITNCTTRCDVRVTCESGDIWPYAGGLAGCTDNCTITNCTAEGNVYCSMNNDGWSYTGGLVGDLDGTIANCSAAGAVTCISTALGAVNNERYNCVGGLLGRVSVSSTIADCSAGGEVKGTTTGSYASSYVGGLIGLNNVPVTGSFAAGNVTGSSANLALIGGLIGWNNLDIIEDCYATGNVIDKASKGESRLGGLVGTNNGSIVGCHAAGSVEGSSASRILAGGLAAFSYSGAITNCYSNGSITIEDEMADTRAGGFIGQNQGTCTVTNCYSAGNVSVARSSVVKVGGFAGYHRAGKISDCYATGNVTNTAQGNDTTKADVGVGGFVGYNLGSITGVYSTGDTKSSVTGVTAYHEVGSFAGTNGGSGTIAKSCFDTQNTSQPLIIGKNYNSAGSVAMVGLTAAKMTGSAAKNNITDFDFSNTWTATSNDTKYQYYPQLKIFSGSSNSSIKAASVNSVKASLTISGFDTLIDDVKTQNVANGTALADLKRPDTLSASINGISQIITGVTWTSNPVYNPTVAGKYTFTAVLPDNYKLVGGVTLPQIIVTVASPASSNNSSSNTTSSEAVKDDYTETKVYTSDNTAVVTVKTDSVTTNGSTASMEATVPSATIDNTLTSTNGSTVDTAKKAEVTINMPTEAIKQQLAAKKNVELTIAVPTEVARDTNTNTAVKINANKAILEAAKESLSDVTIKIKDAGTQQLAYSWTFKGADLAKSTAPMTDVNIAMSVHLTTEVPKVNVITPDNKGLVLSFDHSGVLPATASVKISALEKGFKPGQTLYFYYYNPVTKQIDAQGRQYTVAADGCVTVEIDHCSAYVLLPNAVRSITLDTKNYVMAAKNKYEIGVKLSNAKGTTVKVYSSTKGIASVTKLKNGNYQVTGLKSGLTYIMFDVYDEKNKLISKSHASVRLTVKQGVKQKGDSTRQTAIF